MLGPAIVARTLTVERLFGKDPVPRQYNSRSDHHSKLCCWAVAVDMLMTSSPLHAHVAAGKVTIGVNHTMEDFKLGRKKDLDLVIARPSTSPSRTRVRSLTDLGGDLGVVLTDNERTQIESLPPATPRPVGSVLVALESKACMTEHGKSRPRLFDELNSSQQTIHGAADQAVAVGLALVNAADTFISPGRQRPGEPLRVNSHNQPGVTKSVVDKLRELPRRSAPGTDGFDALGILVVELHNDGSPVSVLQVPPAPLRSDSDHYDAMVLRAAALYDYRFAHI